MSSLGAAAGYQESREKPFPSSPSHFGGYGMFVVRAWARNTGGYRIASALPGHRMKYTMFDEGSPQKEREKWQAQKRYGRG